MTNKSKANIKKIMVTGLPGSGKIILLKLLDGHSKILSAPTHDKIIATMYKFNKDKINKISKNIFGDNSIFTKKSKLNIPVLKFKSHQLQLKLTPYFLRHMLINYSNYYMSEHYSIYGHIIDDSSNFAKNSEKFNFDFQNYEIKWKKNIFSKKILYPEDFVDEFYKAYFDSWLNSKKKYSKNKIIAFLGPNDPINSSSFMINEKFNSKIIFVKRNIEGLLITHSLREMRRLEKNGIILSIEEILIKNMSGNLIIRNKSINKLMHQLSAKYRNKIYLLDIDKFIIDINNNMSDLANFLNLKIEKILFKATNAGKPVSKKFLEKINDNNYPISKPVLQTLYYQIYGISYFVKNFAEIEWRVIIVLLKILLCKIKNKPIIRLLFNKSA